MSSIKQIADDLIITMGLRSDDSKIDIRSIYYWINTKRALLIHRELEKSAFINPAFTQFIPCMNLISVDQNVAVCCNGIPTSCTILRSELKLPKTIPFKGNYGIISISSPMILGKDIKLVDPKNFKYVGNGRHNRREVFCTIIDDYIYIRTKADIMQNVTGKTVSIRLVAENPLDLSSYGLCDSTNTSTSCFSEDTEYPLPDYLVATIKQMVLQDDLKITMTVPEDNSNNSSGDAVSR